MTKLLKGGDGVKRLGVGIGIFTLILGVPLVIAIIVKNVKKNKNN
jgi:hypothetical protein